MSKVIVTKSKLDDIADAINVKAGTSGPMILDDMPSAISAISGGLPDFDLLSAYNNWEWPEAAYTEEGYKFIISDHYIHFIGPSDTEGSTVTCVIAYSPVYCLRVTMGNGSVLLSDTYTGSWWYLGSSADDKLWSTSVNIVRHLWIFTATEAMSGWSTGYWTNHDMNASTWDDTVTAETLLEGYTAHDANGFKITGTYSGGGESHDVEDSLIERTITEYENESAKKVASYAFYSWSSLNKISLTSATSIGQYAFQSCSSLTSASFPAATSIGGSAFYSCSSLTELIIGTDSDKVCTYSTTSSSSDPSNENLKIYVPDDLVDSYKTATNWSRLSSKIYGISERPTE